MSAFATRIRAGAVALAAAGVVVLAHPALRPWHDEGTAAGATASMSSTAWVTAHFCAMLGFILMPLGLLALRSALAPRAEPLALTAAVLAWIGSGLVLPYYGAEDFGLHAIAGSAGHRADLLSLVHAVRYQPLAVTIFGTGLVLLAAAAIMAAIAVWRSHVLPAHPGCGRTGLLARPQEPCESDHRTCSLGGNGATQAAHYPAKWRISS